MSIARCLPLILAIAGITACGADVREVPLAQLAVHQDAYDSRIIETEGRLQRHELPLHYWLADSADHRVELITDEDLAALVGKELSVRGRFRYSPDRGRRIEVVTITAAPDARAGRSVGKNSAP